MAIYRGSGGSTSTTDQATIDQVAEDAATATTKASEAATSATNAASSASSASTSATNAASSASSASSSASSASTSASNASTSASNAASSATNAAASATSASGSATNAATSASAALASKGLAVDAQTAAETAESNASDHASDAVKAAYGAVDVLQTLSDSSTIYSARHYQSKVGSEVTAAAASATAAAASETAAAASETAAAASETAAAGSATSAATSATAAASSATSASGSATTATTKASEAATSATSASGSATTATTKASEAATSATNAATSASTATTKASEASTSATNAASSATAAASSASAAQAAEDAALAALDSFDDRYLGQKASDPTLDNDGNALVAGALYFNTTDSAMKVYDGSNWLAAYASLSGALLAANNLSDLQSASTARTNLGVAIGTDVQAYSSVLAGTTASYTTAEETKLAGIETAATADQTAQEIATAIDADATAEATLKSALGLGTAAYTASTAYATAAQGTLADSAVQPSDNISTLTNDSGYITGVSVSGISDTTITTPADNEVLAYDSTTSKWINQTAAEAGLQPAGSYLTGNQTITLLGDASGSGTTSIAVTVADDSHSHSTSTITGLGALATLSSVDAATITDNSVGAAELNVFGNGSSGQYLISDGDGSFSWNTLTIPDAIPSGTVMLFVQSSAPTGWTKSTTHNNKALRVVSGTVSTGGNAAFTTAFASYTPSGNVGVSGSVLMSGNISNTTLSTNTIPSHNHDIQIGTASASGTAVLGNAAKGFTTYVTDQSIRAANTGNSGAHGHGHNLSGNLSINSTSFSGNAKDLAVQYVDVIIATKN